MCAGIAAIGTLLAIHSAELASATVLGFAEHLHKDAGHVEQKLNSQLLKKLLEMEQQEQLDQLKAKVDAANKPAEGYEQGGWQKLITSPPWLQEGTAAAVIEHGSSVKADSNNGSS